MKGLKKLSILGLGLALTASLAACSNSSSLTNELNAVPEAQQEVYPEVTFDENYEKEDLRLSSIILDTTNAKTTFYLGEEFTTEGLTVNARYLKYENKKVVGKVDVPIDDYSIDASDVNIYKAGTYSVTVSYRVGTVPKTNTYKVTVKNNKYEGTPNAVYLSGIDIAWSDAMQADETFCETNDTTLTVYVNSDPQATEDLKAKLTTSAFNATVYITANDATGSPTISSTKQWNKATFNPVVDCSSVNLAVPGVYMVKLTLTRTITVDGEAITVPVTGFVLISVRDVISSASYAGYYNENGELVENGVIDIPSSIDPIDYSDLAYKLQYYSGSKIVRVGDYPDLFNFSINVISPYKLGTSNVTVKLTEANLNGVYPTAQCDINIVDSGKTFTVYNAKDENDFVGVVNYDEATQKYTDATIGATEQPISIDGNVVAANVAGHNAAVNVDGLSLSYRLKITKSTGYVKVKTTGKGIIRFYADFGSTGNIIVANSKGETLYTSETKAGNNGSKIEEIVTLNCEANDEFVVKSSAGTCYLFGIAIQYEA